MFLAFFSFFAYDNNHSNLSEKTSARSEENQNLSQYEITPIIPKK